MFLVSFFSVLVPVIPFIIILVRARVTKLPRDLTWFGPLWKDFLIDYDDRWKSIASKIESKGERYTSINVDSSKVIGPGAETKVHICGTPSNPVLLLLPGYRATSCMWIPHIEDLLSKHFCIVCLDYPFDLGRSIPGHEGVLVHAPNTHNNSRRFTQFTANKMIHSDEEIKRIMTWLREVLEKLGISQLSSVGGFSLGAYLTCRIALNAPDILKPNAALFIAAPPASLSKFRFSYILPLILRGIVSKITGLPLPFRIATMLKNEYMREVEAGTAEMIDIDSLVKHMEFKDQIVKFDGTTPSIPFLIRRFTDDELQSIVDNFNPTYIGLEWDCWYNCDIAVDRAKKAGMQTAFVEKTTHFVRLTQPHKFNKLLLEALDSSTMSS